MLHYHKCLDCLTSFTTEERHVDECDCNGKVYYMGEVHGEDYEKTENKPPCDGRCTCASGPICDCECGGANHGTGKLVPVVVSKGKVKAIGLSPEDVERAHVFRELRDYTQKVFDARWNSVAERLKKFERVDRTDYFGYINDKKALEKALAMKVYDLRTKALVELVTRLSKGDA